VATRAGALVVGHDRYFIRRFATSIWAIEGGTVRGYVDLEEGTMYFANPNIRATSNKEDGTNR